jgi:hypothetical protein
MQYYNPGTNNFYGGPYTPIQPGPPMMPQTQNTFVWIQGEEAARNYPVAAGNTVVLIDSDKPVMYMKTVDLSGKPQQMQIRYLVTKEDYEKIQNGSSFSPNAEDYVTKEYFEKKMSELDNRFVIKRRDK